MKTIAIILIGLTLGIGLLYFSMKVSYENKNVELKNQVLAQQKSNEANFDKMYKVISQIAQVSEQYRETFKEVYPKLIEGRYGNEKGGALMKWVTESNPTFDPRLYERLATAIESNREDFFVEQKKLIDINREHRNLLAKWPGSFFLNPSDTIHITIVTSQKTGEAFKTGEENDINLFSK